MTHSQFGYTALHAAALNGHLDTVKLLLEKGSDINSRDNNVRTSHAVGRDGKQLNIMYYVICYCFVAIVVYPSTLLFVILLFVIRLFFFC